MRRLSPLVPGSLVIAAAMLTASPVEAQCTGDMPGDNRYCGVMLRDGLGGPNGFGDRCLSPNDDGSSASIDLTPAFPAGLRFFGRTHRSMFVNTNGNISFGEEVGTYTPDAFPVADQPMIAPYWADVDIRGENATGGCASSGFDGDDWATCMIPAGGDNGVYWHLEANRVVVTWDRVGYFACHDDRRMSFQLILTGVDGCGGSDFDVEFRYAQCEWTTGDASGGVDGFGSDGTSCTLDFDCDFDQTCVAGKCIGTPGQAGFDAGNSGTMPPGDFVEIVGSRTDDIHRTLCETSNVAMPGIWQYQIRGGAVICPDAGTTCDTELPGVCSEGRTQCVGGGTECQPVVASSAERCDALDNDCDGMVDDGDGICGARAACVRGTCIETCFEGGCPDGFVCSASMQCVEAGCEDVVCGEGQRCSMGACVDACDGVVCPGGESCLAGRCLDLCASLTCDDCTVCEAGSCIARCDASSCAAGETCAASGACVETSCAAVTCASGQACVAGACVDACTGVVCPRGEMCERGACVTTRETPDAGMTMMNDDGGTLEDVDGGGEAPDGGPAVTIDGGPLCRGPACDADAGRGGCSCATPGAGSHGSRTGAMALGLAVLAALTTRRRQR